MLKAKEEQQEGICPICGKRLDDYGSYEVEGNSIAYEVSCECGFEGFEVHELKFYHFESR